jgi:hypothetical protein
MKKMMMTFAAVLCCVMTLAVFTACEKEKDEFRYTITVLPAGTMTGQTAVTWTNLVLKVYQDALGVGSKEFTKQGEQDKCDKEVFEACKNAEMNLGSLGRGTGEVTVVNVTAKKRIYGKVIQ